MPTHTREQFKRADEIFAQACRDLGDDMHGKMMAIDVAFGDTYIGETEIEAFEAASKRHPGKKFIFKRIGFDVPYFVGAF